MLEHGKEPEKKSYFVDLNADSIDLPALKEIVHKLPQMVDTKLSLLNFFRLLHKKINEGLSRDEILTLVFENLNEIIPFDRIGIALLEKDDKFIRLNWVQSKLQVNHLKQNYSVAIKDTTLGEILKSQTPRILNDLENYYRLHPRSHSTKLALLDGIRSSLTCPITIGGKVTGVIFFSSATKNTYKNLHVDLFCEIAESLSLVTGQEILKEGISVSKKRDKVFHETLHDLNNPLSVIKGTVEMISKKTWYPNLSPEAKHAVDVLDRNTDAMINLIKDIVYNGQNNKEQTLFSGSNCILEDFIKEIMSDASMMAKSKDITIVLKASNNLPHLVNFDAFKIKEAILNYISNALKFSYEGSVITLEISYKAHEKKLYFLVVDQGQGIPESEHHKLFHEYSTTSIKPTSGEPSIGLGLANVKRLVEFHQGEVFFSSKTGSGSSFGFWIPNQGN